jgi:hypothetical protein
MTTPTRWTFAVATLLEGQDDPTWTVEQVNIPHKDGHRTPRTEARSLAVRTLKQHTNIYQIAVHMIDPNPTVTGTRHIDITEHPAGWWRWNFNTDTGTWHLTDTTATTTPLNMNT